MQIMKQRYKDRQSWLGKFGKVITKWREIKKTIIQKFTKIINLFWVHQ